jgi:hypothetical protein
MIDPPSSGAWLQKASGHALAETGAAAGDENALTAEKIGSKHHLLLSSPARSPTPSDKSEEATLSTYRSGT